MNWKEFIKPTIAKLIILIILFTIFPWPRQIYVTPMFHTAFLFYGPATLSKILAIPFVEYPEVFSDAGAIPYFFGRLFSVQMQEVYLSFAIFLIICYVLSCLIANKTKFLNPTKNKVRWSFAIFFISLLGFFVLVKSSSSFYNENALTLTIMLPFILFSITYFVWSLFEKK